MICRSRILTANELFGSRSYRDGLSRLGNRSYKVVFFLIFIFSFLYSFDFLDLGAGARPLGMGNAFVSVSDDANAPYFNPAGTGEKINPEITYMHAVLPTGAMYDYFSGVLSVKYFLKKNGLSQLGNRSYNNGVSGLGNRSYRYNGEIICSTAMNGLSRFGNRSYNFGLGFSFFRVATPEVPVYEAVYDTIPGSDYTKIIYKGTARFLNETYLIAFSFKGNKNISAGFSLKYIRIQIVDYKAKGFSGDLGFIIKKEFNRELLNEIRLGFKFENLIRTPFEWNTGFKEEIKKILRAGASFKFYKNFLLSFSINDRKEYSAGAEWKVMGFLPLRLGIENEMLTFGIGIEVKRVYVDYAYASHPDLNVGHRIGIGIRW